jgi:hypothetical protein
MLRSSNRVFPLAISRTFATGAAVIAITMGLAGCATGSSSDETADEDLTPEQLAIRPYVNEVDEICKTERLKMAKLLDKYESHESVSGGTRRKSVRVAKPEDVEGYVGALVPKQAAPSVSADPKLNLLEIQQTKIRKVELPSGAPGKQLDALWTKAESIIVTVKKDPAQAIYDDPFQSVAKSLKSLGFSQCFQPKRPDTEQESSDSVPDTTVTSPDS